MFFDSWYDLARVLCVGAVAYVALVVMLRGSGPRTLSKLSAFDLVVTVALGSTLATVLLSKDVSLTEGVLAFAVLIGLQFFVTWTSVRWPGFNKLMLDGQHNGHGDERGFDADQGPGHYHRHRSRHQRPDDGDEAAQEGQQGQRQGQRNAEEQESRANADRIDERHQHRPAHPAAQSPPSPLQGGARQPPPLWRQRGERRAHQPTSVLHEEEDEDQHQQHPGEQHGERRQSAGRAQGKLLRVLAHPPLGLRA